MSTPQDKSFFASGASIIIEMHDSMGSHVDNNGGFIGSALNSLKCLGRRMLGSFDLGVNFLIPDLPSAFKKDNVDKVYTKEAKAMFTKEQRPYLGKFAVVDVNTNNNNENGPNSQIVVSGFSMGFVSNMITLQNMQSIFDLVREDNPKRTDKSNEIFRDMVLGHEVGHTALHINHFIRKNNDLANGVDSFQRIHIDDLSIHSMDLVSLNLANLADENVCDVYGVLHALKKHVLDKTSPHEQIEGIKNLQLLHEDFNHFRKEVVPDANAKLGDDTINFKIHDTRGCVSALFSMIDSELKSPNGLNKLRERFGTNENIFDFSLNLGYGYVTANIDSFIEKFAKQKSAESEFNMYSLIGMMDDYKFSEINLKVPKDALEKYAKSFESKDLLESIKNPREYDRLVNSYKAEMDEFNKISENLKFRFAPACDYQESGVKLWEKMRKMACDEQAKPVPWSTISKSLTERVREHEHRLLKSPSA